MLFAHALQPFAGASVYRDSDNCALLAVCSCHCSKTMVEADFMQLSLCNWLHLGMNMLALSNLRALCEREYGAKHV